MSNKLIAIIMSLALFVGLFTTASASASTSVAVANNNTFDSIAVNDEVHPQWVPAVAFVAALAGGLTSSRNVWVVGNNLSVDEKLDYEEMSVVFDR